MEEQSETSCKTKLFYNCFPFLLTLNIVSHLNAKTFYPIPVPLIKTTLSYSAVPILANTIASLNDLKVVNATTIISDEMSRAESATAVVEEVKKVEVASNAAPAPLATEAATTISFETSSKEDRRKYIAYFAESHTDWGFKYRYGGEKLDKGIDCSGFTRYVFNYFDIKTSRTSTEQYNDGLQIPVENAKTGDLVFFGGKKYINHVALVVSNDKNGLVVVHSCNRGIIKENITESSYWRSKLKSTAVSIMDK